jgi:hypothetical protein
VISKIMARAGGLAQGDWNEDAEPEGFVGEGMELVDETGDSTKPTASSKPTQVWAPLSGITAAPEVKKSEPYRPGAHLAKKQHDGFFPELGAQASSEPIQKAPVGTSTNRFDELQTEEPEPVAATVTPQSEEKKSRKKKKNEWKQVELQAVVATTQAQQELVIGKEAEEMYKPKITKAYVERTERRSDYTVSETDNVWRKANTEAPAPSAPSGFKPPPRRPEEPFRRGDDSAPIRREERSDLKRPEEPFRRGDDSAPIRREDRPEPKPESGPWRSPLASSPPASDSQAKEAGTEGPRKFMNTKKKTEEPAPPTDSWKAADQQPKPRVNMWALGDPRV